MSMILLQALLELNLFEHGSANPFVSLVSSVEFRINQLKGTSIDSILAKKSLVSQLSNLLAIFRSVKNWIIPEEDIRQNLDLAVPVAESYTKEAISAIERGDLRSAIDKLDAARAELIKHSHLEFK